MTSHAAGQAYPGQLNANAGATGGRAIGRSSVTAAKARTKASVGRASVVIPKPPLSARILNMIGRIGIFAIPLLAIAVALGQRATRAYTTDRAAYLDYLANDRREPMELVTTIGTGVLTLIAMIGVAALVHAGRGRIAGLIGLILGVCGTILLMITAGSAVLRATAAARPIINGDWSRIAFNARLFGTTDIRMVFGGVALVIIGWALLGIAVYRTWGLNHSDGVLLAIAALLVYAGGFFLTTLPTMGSFLLGAAGLGIIFTAGRVAHATPVVPGAAAAAEQQFGTPLARFVDAPEDEADPAPEPRILSEEVFAPAGAEPELVRVGGPADPEAGTEAEGALAAAAAADGAVAADRARGSGYGPGNAGPAKAAGGTNAGPDAPSKNAPAVAADASPNRDTGSKRFARLSRGVATSWPVNRKGGGKTRPPSPGR